MTRLSVSQTLKWLNYIPCDIKVLVLIDFSGCDLFCMLCLSKQFVYHSLHPFQKCNNLRECAQGSVPMRMRCGGFFNDHLIITCLLLSLVVIFFLKSVNIWQSYGQEYSVLLYFTHGVHTARLNLSPILTLRLILILSLTPKVTPVLILTVTKSQFNHSDVPYLSIGGHTVLARA